MRRRQRCQRNAERLQLREAVGGADLACRDRANRAAVDEGRLIAQGETLRRVALQADIQAGQRQCHAAAAAELAAFHPGREPLAAGYSLILHVFRTQIVVRGKAETLNPLPAAARAQPMPEPAADIADPLYMGEHVGRSAGPATARGTAASCGGTGAAAGAGASLVRRSTCSRGAWSVLWRD